MTFSGLEPFPETEPTTVRGPCLLAETEDGRFRDLDQPEGTSQAARFGGCKRT